MEFNAVFVVNIVMSMGLAVEFCAHIAIAFLKVEGTRAERARLSLENMGSAVLVGIASTKLIGKAKVLVRCDCACIRSFESIQAVLLQNVSVDNSAGSVQWADADANSSFSHWTGA